jgi:hydrogenase maturation protein HypF
MAVSYLGHHFGRSFLNWQIPFVQHLDRHKTEVVLQMIRNRVNSPLTSSCGRLFDAVSALAGVRQQVNYEAQAAIELEMAISGTRAEPAYPLDLILNDRPWVISTRRMFEAMIRDIESGKTMSTISQRFHDGLIEVLVRAANLIRQRTWLEQVCLSGGTFQNSYLVESLSTRLEAEGFEVFTQNEVPAGDGGLSLGQIVVAAHALKKQERKRRNTALERFAFHA